MHMHNQNHMGGGGAGVHPTYLSTENLNQYKLCNWYVCIGIYSQESWNGVQMHVLESKSYGGGGRGGGSLHVYPVFVDRQS